MASPQIGKRKEKPTKDRLMKRRFRNMGKEVPKEAVFERRHLEFVECPGGGGEN